MATGLGHGVGVFGRGLFGADGQLWRWTRDDLTPGQHAIDLRIEDDTGRVIGTLDAATAWIDDCVAAFARDDGYCWAVVDDADLAANIKGGDMGPRSIIGSNAQLVDEIGKYVEMGFDELIVPDFTLGGTYDERVERYAEFRAEIVSQVS